MSSDIWDQFVVQKFNVIKIIPSNWNRDKKRDIDCRYNCPFRCINFQRSTRENRLRRCRKNWMQDPNRKWIIQPAWCHKCTMTTTMSVVGVPRSLIGTSTVDQTSRPQLAAQNRSARWTRSGRWVTTRGGSCASSGSTGTRVSCDWTN